MTANSIGTPRNIGIMVAHQDAGIVHQQRNRPERLLDARRQRIARGNISDIEAMRMQVRPVHYCHGGADRVGIDIGHDHSRADVGQAAGNGGTIAAGRAGDQREASGERSFGGGEGRVARRHGQMLRELSSRVSGHQQKWLEFHRA